MHSLTRPKIELQLNLTMHTRAERPYEPVVSQTSRRESMTNLVNEARNSRVGCWHECVFKNTCSFEHFK